MTKARPVILLIDDVLDSGNLGAIIRSAYFLGADAVVLTDHVAPLSAVTLKASAGAAEALDIYRVEKPSDMLAAAREQGWNVLCATTPSRDPVRGKKKQRVEWKRFVDRERGLRHYISQSDQDIELDDLYAKPQIVVIGGEGRGLRPFLTKEADAFVQIISPRETTLKDFGLDSLNVSVAAGVVLQEVMGRLRQTPQARPALESTTAVAPISGEDGPDDEDLMFNLKEMKPPVAAQCSTIYREELRLQEKIDEVEDMGMILKRTSVDVNSPIQELKSLEQMKPGAIEVDTEKKSLAGSG
jgi:tRNA G18 (ribose-2'-O)-methylase SpoU